MYNIILERILLNRFKLIYTTDTPKYLRALTGYWLYNVLERKFINGSPDRIYTAAWDGEEFINVSFDKLSKTYSANTLSTMLVMSDDI